MFNHICKVSIVIFFAINMFIPVAIQANESLDYPIVRHKAGPRTPVFRRLKATINNGQLVVKGKLVRRFKHQIPTRGHVDIVIKNKAGNILLETTAKVTPAFIHRDSRHASRFSVTIPNIPPQGSSIHVGFHKDAIQKDKPPSHSESTLI
ncbi:MAG: hypothetical protein JKY67_20620 [Pseudomonadales bacterium]|nr:hypothetical protein [Pseudomonadales bacterium]